MRRLLAGLVGIAVVAGALAWFSEPFQEPTQAAQEATLTAKHVEIALPAELALGDVQSMVALPYIDDFEGPWPGPWQETGDLLWDRVDCNFHSPTHSASASGDPTCTTYYNDQWSWLIYGPFDLSGATAAGADYWLDIDTMQDFDYFWAVASADGTNYCGWQLSGYSDGWINAYPLDFADPGCPNLLGDPDVWFAFAFTSTPVVTYPGAWVDDVNIWADIGPPPEGCWTGLPPLAAGADLAPPSPAETGEDIGVREGTPPSAAGEEAIPGQLIVKFNPSVSQSEGEAAVKLEGVILLRHLLVPGYALVAVPKGEEEQLIARLEANPKVELAEPNAIRRATFVPNDPGYPLQWHLPQIQMEQAWDVANGSGVVVAVIDSGVAYENYDGYVQAPDLAGTSFTPGCDFENNDYHPNDDDGHGTHVAGTVAQTTNNSLGVAGVAYGATIMPVKVLDEYGSGSVANIADGIAWAADYGADVINLSLGGGYASVEEDAINYALANGVVVVAATGNENASSLGCPACYPGVIAVGATDYAQNRAPYSNYGCDPEGTGHCLDVMAPGGNTGADLNGDTYPDGVLQQTLLDACPEPLQVDVDPPFAYCLYQGTSMASPHVAGAAALLLDDNPSLTVQQVGDCLRDNAQDLGPAGYDPEYGHGLIQVRDALDACGGSEPADVKIIGQDFVDPPAEIAVSQNVDITLSTFLHHNGPYGPVEVALGYSATAPADCTITPPSHSEQVFLPVSVDATVDEQFTIHCSKPSEHTFSFEMEIVTIKDPHVVDPDLTNNSGSAELTVAAIGEADVKIVAQYFVDPPAEIAVSQNVDITLSTFLHHNGPYGPVEVALGYSATAPADCSVATVGSPQYVLPVSVDMADDHTWTIHCSRPSEHTFSFTTDIVTIKDPHVVDPDLANNSGSAELTVAAIGSADVKIVDQYFVDPPTTIVVSEDTPVTLRKVLHNNGPYPDAVTMTIDKTATAPADCTITPPSHSEQVVLPPVSVPVTVDEQFTIHCLQPGRHTFTVDNSVSGLKEPHMIDPDVTNNTAQSTLTVGHLEGADVKVVNFWTDPPEVDAQVSQWVVVNAGEYKHNNGPQSATAWASWTIDNPPEVNVRWLAQPGDECTLNGALVPCDSPGDINDLHFEVPLPVSVTMEVFRDFEIHCKEPGPFVLTLGNEEWPIGLLDPDLNNNYLETQLVVHCGDGEPAIVRIGSGSAPTCTEAPVPVEVIGAPAPGVGAITLDIVYNPAVAEPTKAAGGDAYNMVECKLDYAPNTVRCAGLSTAGVPGDSLLADITFHCIGETGQCSPLEVQIVTFADPDGIPILPVTAEDGEFCCGLCGNVDCDTDVDAVDALFVLQYVVGMRAASDQCPLPPDTLYLPAANVNCDSIVDAVDALFILQHVVSMRPDLCVCTEP